jgi:hypothetical protein
MTVLDNDLVNTIQAERRAQASSERVANSMRPTAPSQARVNTLPRSTWGWVRSSVPTLARLVLAR